MFLIQFRWFIARIFWTFNRWKLVREKEHVEGPRILIGAPHTSNYDFLLMLAIAWDAKIRVHWLGKRELFKGIAGPIMRGLGGIPVDRKKPAGLVETVIEKAKSDKRFVLVVTPEGTRRGKGWRSGFYRIAYEADMPVTLGFADGATKSAGLGTTIKLSGDVVSDMNKIRDFYRDITGVRKEFKTEPRLSDEEGLTKLFK
ncbi:MAG TPA: 1-acyl-sn-glycerol-3-phosphate acyltransferase [Microbacteriaceae bacterium]|nr:1-acyl-sn-glycerol-3-phosphate acyltransferase [Microbacteriaceae bacterium]